MLEVSAVCLHACMKTIALLVNCIVNDALVNVTPHLLHTLFQFVSVVHPRLVHSLLHDAPDPVINRIKVRAVRCPKIRWNAGVTREVAQCRVPVCWGVVLLKDEKFPIPRASRVVAASTGAHHRSKCRWILMPGSTKTRSVQPSFDMPTDTIRD